MKSNKLYNVLVLGGALLAGQAASAEQGLRSGPRSAAAPSAEEQPLETGFCKPSNPENCVTNACGQSVPREGFVCCWGTSCADEPGAGAEAGTGN
jgi:hypothetical protein